MQRAAITAMLLLCGCATLDAHVIDDRPAPGWCGAPPHPFEATYDDGTPFVRTRKMENAGAVEWTFFDKNGAPILIERDVDQHALYIASYYPSGQKRLSGAYRIDGDPPTYEPQGRWEFFEEDGTPDQRPVADDFLTYYPITWGGDAHYPAEMQYYGIRGDTCMLVCVGADGGVVGAYPVKTAVPEFNEASVNTMLGHEVAPRRIGDLALPSCTHVETHFR